MIYYIDIDDTICTLSESMNYGSATPIPKAIEKVNRLYEEGHRIVFWTARGTVSGKDWRQLTESQLISWEVKITLLKILRMRSCCIITRSILY